MLEKIAGFIKVAGTAGIALMAGAGCYHHYLLYSSASGAMPDKPSVRWEVVEEAKVQESNSEDISLEDLPADTPEEIAEEMYCDGLELLAMCVEAEAGNQDLLGKRLVVDVILNRVDDPDWPDTIEGVITKPYEISTWWDGRLKAAEPSEESYLAVQMELEERSYPGLFYFTAGDYSKYGTPWRKVGDHYFSTK